MDNLKVWWVLVWDSYYPLGALGNVRDTFLTKEEADAYVAAAEVHEDWGVNVEVINVNSLLGLVTKYQWDESSSEDE